MRTLMTYISVSIAAVSALNLLTAAAAQSPAAQTKPAPPAATAATVIPALIRYSSVAAQRSGDKAAGESSVTFLIFKDEEGGEPLWTETQMVTFDASGHYEVYLGAGSVAGLPADLFSTGEARWLEVQVAGAAPEARALLTSVPYALKAADATTLGGLPVTAFVLAGTGAAARGETVSPEAAANSVTTPGGAAGYLPVYSGATSIDDSLIFQSGLELGINTKTPAATLDVNGGIAARGAFALESAGTASTAAGVRSQPLDFFASVYDSSAKKATSPEFTLQAEPAGNNTTASGATLNLLYGDGAAAHETGLSISANGLIHFAAGQTFGSSSTSGTSLSGTSTSGTGVDGTSTTGNGVLGNTAGGTLNTAGVRGFAGSASGFGGIAGVWGDAFSHVGVLGTSYQYAGVQGISQIGQGVQGQSQSNAGVQGTSASGPGIWGTSDTSNGVWGITAGISLYTAGVLGSAGTRTSFQAISGVWGDAAAHVGVSGTSNQYAGVEGKSTSGNGVHGVSQGTSGIFGETSSTSAQDAGLFGYSHANAVGVYGFSGPNNGVHGVSQSTSGIFGETSSTSAQDAGLFGYSHANSMGVYGSSVSGSGVVGYSPSATGVQGSAGDGGTGVRGIGTTGFGVYGSSATGTAAFFANNSASAPALVATNSGDSNGTAVAILGINGADAGIGVEGETLGGIAVYGAVGITTPGNRLSGIAGDVGLLGDATAGGGVAVRGAASDSNAAIFTNNSIYSTIYAENYGSGNTGQDAIGPFGAFQAVTRKGSCGFGGNGDLTCTGQVKALATTGNGTRMVETYAVQSPENWMEDFGSATLVHGVAKVAIDPAFAETVSAGAGYHIFLTPNGDSNGLYVAAKSAGSFEVRESGGGSSNIGFDYRIVASRRGYEGQRMVDVTEAVKAASDRAAAQAKKLTPEHVAAAPPKHSSEN